jgi:transposase
MRTTATRHAQDTSLTAGLFLAFELREKTGKLGCSIGHGHQPRDRMLPAREQQRWLADIAPATARCGLPDTVPVVSCDDAGREGFWRHRFLPAHRRRNHGVDASSIAVNRRTRRAKSEALDVRKLLRMLMRYAYGERQVWRVVPVPSVDAAEQRHLPRALETLQPERARTTPRLQGVRSRQGLRLTSLSQVAEPREALRRWDGTEMPSGRRRRVLRVSVYSQFLRAPMAAVDAERRAVLHRAHDASLEQGRQLMQRKGIGSNGSWVLVRALFGGRALQHRREVGS